MTEVGNKLMTNAQHHASFTQKRHSMGTRRSYLNLNAKYYNYISDFLRIQIRNYNIQFN